MKKIPRLAVKPEFAYRLFYPQVPSILCAKSTELCSMPVSSAVPVSDSPARIAVAVKKQLKTDRVLKKSSSFSLNWLDFKKRNLIVELSQSAVKGNDKLKALKIPYRMVLGTPVLNDSLAYAVLKKERMINVGDHNLFLGEVIGAMASLDFDEYWKFQEYNPILYLGSGKKKKFVTI